MPIICHPPYVHYYLVSCNTYYPNGMEAAEERIMLCSGPRLAILLSRREFTVGQKL